MRNGATGEACTRKDDVLAAGVIEPQVLYHGQEQSRPAFEVQISGERAQFGEKPLSPPAFASQQLIATVKEIKQRVKEECENVQRCQRLAEVV